MDISVIIVNYNVKYFLEQCLYSVQAALKNVQGEIIVIDNASIDNSIDYLQSKFPSVKFIANKENSGFGKACNQGFKLSSGHFILFLNPDTIVAEDCFKKCLSFLNSHPDAGALGVKMLDGSGKFLKESKRAFPSLSASAYKFSGLSGLFPHSKIFAKYQLGHLDENHNHEVDVLAGAFMLVKRNVLETTGGFDEDFFMYGEDIDLSYRVKKSGFKNYYFSETEIIHFKGESTKKKNLEYVKMFYNAMSIFVNKHYKSDAAGIFKFFIHTGIWMVAFFSAIGSFVRNIFSFLKNGKNKNLKTVVAGTEQEYQSVLLLLKNNDATENITGRIAIDENDNAGLGFIKNISALAEKYSFNEMIVCSGGLSYKRIIESLKEKPGNISIKIHASGSNSIVGGSAKE